MTGEGSIDERVDPDRLRVEHPSWRLFRAHPALGLEETDGGCVLAPRAAELGVAWLALDLGEQQARERDLLRELLRRAAGGAGARFEAGASLTADGTARGALTDDAVDALVTTPPRRVVVEAGEMVLDIGEEPLGIGVWMDRWKALALERELLDHVWEEARGREPPTTTVDGRHPREVDRAFRAQLVVAWARHGGKVAFGAFGLAAWLGWHPLGDGDWADGAVLLIGGLATALGIEWLVDRWYRRARSGSAE